jgi:hypothetical protein
MGPTTMTQALFCDALRAGWYVHRHLMTLSIEYPLSLMETGVRSPDVCTPFSTPTIVRYCGS